MELMKPIRKIRTALAIFIALLLLSGITAFPLRCELDFLVKHKSLVPELMRPWIDEIYDSLIKTPELVLYGTDWLAFAHIVISLFFVPLFFDPVKYKANLYVGMTACVLIFPLAFIFGPVRGIPFFHQLIDCSFGLFGFLNLYLVLRAVNKLENTTS